MKERLRKKAELRIPPILILRSLGCTDNYDSRECP
jgi:hypothetical protein